MWDEFLNSYCWKEIEAKLQERMKELYQFLEVAASEGKSIEAAMISGQIKEIKMFLSLPRLFKSYPHK